jgi:hypothetical protein
MYRSTMKFLGVFLLLLWPAAFSQTSRQTMLDRDAFALLQQDFVAFDSHYKEEREPRVARTYALAKKMFDEESKGGKTACGHQILFELESLLVSSADFKLIDSRLHDLESSIGHPSSDKADTEEMWGSCYVEWYLKLYATYDHLEAQSEDEPAPHQLPGFLARVSAPEKLTAYLDALSISDVRHTGIDHEREFNETLATLLQIIVRRKPQNYTVEPALRDALLDRVLHRYRNPETGYLGRALPARRTRRFP